MKRSMYQGRPLYFLAGVLLCWTGIRSGLWVWPVPETEANIVPGVQFATGRAKFQIARSLLPLKTGPLDAVPPDYASFSAALSIKAYAAQQTIGYADSPKAVMRAAAYFEPPMPAERQLLSPPILTAAPRTAAAEPPVGGAKAVMLASAQPLSEERSLLKPVRSDRWSMSSWMLWRDGGGARPSSGDTIPLYGASQLGARLAYRVDSARPIDLYARASAPLHFRDGKEVALGAAISPIKGANLAVAVEQRFRLDGARKSAPAVLAYGGFGPAPFGPVEAEGYAQGGIVGLRDPILFADGALVVRRRVAQIGNNRLYIGAGIWGGAQRGASRLDVGPRVGVDVPINDGPNLRLAVDWRQRVAGSANPGSGPAISLGTDF